MGKVVQSASSTLFAKGETGVKVCAYGSVSAKDYLRSGTLYLTSKRLIHHIHEEGRGTTADHQNEIPVSDIDGISYALELKRKPVSSLAIVIAALLFIAGIVTFITVKHAVSIGIGIALILAAALIVFLAFLLRKEMTSFRFSVSTYNNIHHQFGFGNVPEAVLDEQEKKKISKAGRILGLLIPLVIIIVGVVFIVTNMNKGNPDMGMPVMLYVGAGLVGAGALIFLASLVRPKRNKPNQVALVNGVALENATINVNAKECRDFLNDIGSAINEIKERK